MSRYDLHRALGDQGLIPPAVDDELRAFVSRESPLARLFPRRKLTRRERLRNRIGWFRFRLGLRIGNLIAGQELGDDR